MALFFAARDDTAITFNPLFPHFPTSNINILLTNRLWISSAWTALSISNRIGYLFDVQLLQLLFVKRWIRGIP